MLIYQEIRTDVSNGDWYIIHKVCFENVFKFQTTPKDGFEFNTEPPEVLSITAETPSGEVVWVGDDYDITNASTGSSVNIWLPCVVEKRDVPLEYLKEFIVKLTYRSHDAVSSGVMCYPLHPNITIDDLELTMCAHPNNSTNYRENANVDLKNIQNTLKYLSGEVRKILLGVGKDVKPQATVFEQENGQTLSL